MNRLGVPGRFVGHQKFIQVYQVVGHVGQIVVSQPQQGIVQFEIQIIRRRGSLPFLTEVRVQDAGHFQIFTAGH
jgi:hypothetical protein